MSDAHLPSRVQAVPIELADKAAEDLESFAEPKRLNDQKFPWLYPPPGRPHTQRVTDAWFKSPSNIARVEAYSGKKFKSKDEPQLSLHSSYPVVFTQTDGRLKTPFQKQYLVMIALGKVHLGNGLVTNAEVDSLASGQDLIVSGDDEMRFSKGGGGMAVFLILDL